MMRVKLSRLILSTLLVLMATACGKPDEMAIKSVSQTVLADGVLNEDEVNKLLDVADELGMETSQAVLLLCDMVKTRPELEVVVGADEYLINIMMGDGIVNKDRNIKTLFLDNENKTE